MNQKIVKYLKELKAYGIKNNIPNVTERVGQLLNMLIKMNKSKKILEIGSANGYSTIWLAEAAKSIGGKVTTYDFSEPTFYEAQENMKKAGLSDYVDFNLGDALNLIPVLPENEKFDFIFVDGQKKLYLDFWNLIQNRMNENAIIVFDDVLAFPEKTKPFNDAMDVLQGFDKVLLPIDVEVGDGIMLLYKS